MKTEPNEMASPKMSSTFDFCDVNNEKPYTSIYSEGGLTKREHFAAMAMQGLLAYNGSVGSQGAPDTLVGRSVELADALITALNNQP